MEKEKIGYSVRPDTREDDTHLSTNLGEAGRKRPVGYQRLSLKPPSCGLEGTWMRFFLR